MHLRRFYRLGLVEGRDIGHAFHIKINRGHGIELAQRFLHRRRKYLPNGLFVFKFDLRLRRMYVYINVGRIYIKINKIRNLFTNRNQLFVCIHHCFVEIRMTHIAAVHKEILMGTFLTCSLRFGNKTGYLYHSGIYTH